MEVYSARDDIFYRFSGGPGSGPRGQKNEPYTFDYAHNTQKAPKQHNGEFGTDIEPHGRYVSQREKGDRYDSDPKYQTGSLTFQNPMHLDFGGGYGDESNWKNQLSSAYGGLKGKALSKAVMKDGHDGIVTHDKYGPSEIVDLTGFH